jgi:4-hydroxy-tetrahydrodipicolinate synthase
MVGVDTQVYHGFLRCGALGAITGIGNCLPHQVLKLVSLCQLATSGDVDARCYAQELDEALCVLSNYDEGPDLVLYYKHLMVLLGDPDYRYHFNQTDCLSSGQRRFAEEQLRLFLSWWDNWRGKSYGHA